MDILRLTNRKSVEDLWFFSPEELQATPSIIQGCTPKQEGTWRIAGIKIIMAVGPQLKLKAQQTLATAAVFFHRFYMFHSFQEYKYEFVALGALFLAGKVEDTPKKINNIVSEAITLDNFKGFTPGYIHDQVLGIERVLLPTLKFDLYVDHPYKYLLEYLKELNISGEQGQQFAQMAWTFVNDSVYTTLCLEWEPQVIAIVMVHLTYEYKKMKPINPDWYHKHVTILSKEILDAICHKVLDFYLEVKEVDSKSENR